MKLKAFILGLLLAPTAYAAGPAGRFVEIRQTLQPSSTFYVSSGTVNNLNSSNIKSNELSVSTVNYNYGSGISALLQNVSISSLTVSTATINNATISSASITNGYFGNIYTSTITISGLIDPITTIEGVVFSENGILRSDDNFVYYPYFGGLTLNRPAGPQSTLDINGSFICGDYFDLGSPMQYLDQYTAGNGRFSGGLEVGTTIYTQLIDVGTLKFSDNTTMTTAATGGGGLTEPSTYQWYLPYGARVTDGGQINLYSGSGIDSATTTISGYGVVVYNGGSYFNSIEAETINLDGSLLFGGDIGDVFQMFPGNGISWQSAGHTAISSFTYDKGIGYEWYQSWDGYDPATLGMRLDDGNLYAASTITAGGNLVVSGDVSVGNPTSGTGDLRVNGYGDGGYGTRGIIEGYNQYTNRKMFSLSDDGSGAYGLLGLHGSHISSERLGEWNFFDYDLGSDKRAATMAVEWDGVDGYYWNFTTRRGSTFHSNTINLSPDGNVGIGNSPTSGNKLDVNGKLMAGAGPTRPFLDSYGTYSAYLGADNTNMLEMNVDEFYLTSIFPHYFQNGLISEGSIDATGQPLTVGSVTTTSLLVSATSYLNKVDFRDTKIFNSTYTDPTGVYQLPKYGFQDILNPQWIMTSNRLGEMVLKSSTTAISGGVGISGCVLNPYTGRALLVDNNAVDIKEINPMNPSVNYRLITLSGFSDPEALEYMWYDKDRNRSTYVVAEEGLNRLTTFEVDESIKNQTIYRSTWTSVVLPVWAPDASNGMESLTYNPDTNEFYVAKQRTNLDFYICSNSSPSVCREPFDAQAAWSATISECNDMSYNRSNGHVYAISNTSNRVIEFDKDTGVIYSTNAIPSSLAFTQEEGFALSQDGRQAFYSSEGASFAWFSLDGAGTSSSSSGGSSIYPATATASFPYGLTASSVSATYTEIGYQTFNSNAGSVALVDMPVTSGASSGTEESISLNIDNNPILKIYSESDGAGSIRTQNVRIKTGLASASTSYAAVGGTILTSTISVPFVAAGGSPTTFWNKTVSSATLQNVGDSLEFKIVGQFTGAATTKSVDVQYGGNYVIQSGALASITGVSYSIRGTIMRTSSSTVKSDAFIIYSSTSFPGKSEYHSLNVNNTASQSLVHTGLGNNSSDIYFEFGKVKWEPAY